MIIDLLLRFKKPLGIIALFLATLSAGYWYGVESVEPVIVTKVETVEKEVIKEVIVEKIVEVIKIVTKKDEEKEKTTVVIENPDGTKKTTITEKTKTKQESSTDKDKNKDLGKETDKIVDKTEKSTPTVVSPKKPNRYRTGVFAAATTKEITHSDFRNLDYGVLLGVRAFGPIWVESTYKIDSKYVTLGASVEF